MASGPAARQRAAYSGGKKPLPCEMTNDLNTHERTLEIQTQTITPRNINMNNNTQNDKEKRQKPENALKGCEVTAQENW